MRKKIVIVGLGLIGGSFAKALKLNTEHTVLGIDIAEETLLDACSCGAIDRKATHKDLLEADMIYLCTYPEGAVEFVAKYGAELKEGCILTDACGIKRYLCARIEELQKGCKFLFVAGHPMAGKEHCGFSASDPSIFVGASYLIAPCHAPERAVREVAQLAEKMGFGHIVMTDPESHDKMIAYTSQVPHVLACAYVMSPQCRNHQGFSAGSYRDVSRVALINDKLWTGLFLENREMLVQELDTLQENIRRLRDAIEGEDKQGLQEMLCRAAQIKREEG